MTAVGEPVDCPNVSTVAQKYTSIFQEFLQASALPVWDRHKNAGFWRQFTVYFVFRLFTAVFSNGISFTVYNFATR